MKCSKIALGILLFCCMHLVACKKEDPTPELRDPIYSDLQKRAADSKKAFEEASAQLAELRISLEKQEPNSIELKDVQKDIQKHEAMVLRSDQEARYYRIRSDRRKFEDRIEYKRAVSKNQPWPNQNEYSDYLVNIRLREINLNWGARVPRSQDRKPAAAKKAEEAPKSEN